MEFHPTDRDRSVGDQGRRQGADSMVRGRIDGDLLAYSDVGIWTYMD
jgi:hypothetical protein